MMNLEHAKRKNEHLSLAEKFYDAAHQAHPFDQVRLIPNALPEMATTEFNPQVQINGLTLQWPFYFEAMTGGSEQAKTVNMALARVANKTGIAMATGSLSPMFKLPQFNDSFQVVRNANPTGTIIANLGANVTVKQARQAIDLLQADALEIHLNVAQEAAMAEGDRNFHWRANIQQLVEELPVPVIVKEVGFGMSRATIQQLMSLGVKTINLSGRGGTNFVQIENRRNHVADFSDLTNWGLTTPESLLEAAGLDQVTLLASGGVTGPLDVIKAGVLGAQAVGVAGYFLHRYYQDGEEGLLKAVQTWQTEVTRIMTMLGCRHFSDLSQVDFVLDEQLYNYVQQRHLNH
ncbi:type 2 isopentenyl-diphosphate Delta-isomerase [Limosilactobacillus caecicola]|uniref:type 2 isopentenyl-diphosphate Delta-isomerase n=1 Tax=Limosilactobacillus caecicola TaxID=2941332 RepID=UPI002040304C|nr:type 2 isopentenyl-diphosphate Delta-isomerase [Limosilactobacillus caecicola]